jgi:hypothetical protein
MRKIMFVRLVVCASSFALFYAGFVACGDSTFQSASTDGGPDATSDAVVVADGAPPDASVSTSDPCSGDSGYLVCDDFDEAALKGIWGTDSKCVNPTLDNSIFVSSPQSLLAQNEQDGGLRSCAYLSTAIAKHTPRAHCEVDVNIGNRPTTLVTIFEITTNFDAIAYHQVDIGYDGTNPASNQPFSLGEAAVQADGGGAAHDTIIAAGPSTVDGWFHVSLDVDYTNSTASATVAAVTASLSLLAAPIGKVVNEADLRVGFSQAGDAGVTTVHYDNVFCEAN